MNRILTDENVSITALIISLLSLLLVGCAGPQLVNLRGKSQSQYAPTNEQILRGGVIKYPNNGSMASKQRLRERSYKQMHDYCEGPYQITEESPITESRPGLATTTLIPGSAISVTSISRGTDPYWYVWFKCEGNEEARK